MTNEEILAQPNHLERGALMALNGTKKVSGGGGPITLRLNGTDRTGHAVATRDDRGRVTVTVKLDER
jgi:hypothetical protein